MVHVNLESLSTSELRNLAQSEKIDGFEDMDRDDLIQGLLDKFDIDLDNFGLEDDYAKSLNIKYVHSFSDYLDNTASLSDLPGVEELPSYYQETSIHFLYKNSDWGYAFWSISSLDEEKIEERKGSPILVVTMDYKNGTREKYDIIISDDDRQWNIGFSLDALSCFVSLVVEYPDGNREILCQSNVIKLPSIYWLEHRDEMKKNDTLFKVYLSLLTTKTGEVVNNAIVSDIINDYKEEDAK